MRLIFVAVGRAVCWVLVHIGDAPFNLYWSIDRALYRLDFQMETHMLTEIGVYGVRSMMRFILHGETHSSTI